MFKKRKIAEVAIGLQELASQPFCFHCKFGPCFFSKPADTKKAERCKDSHLADSLLPLLCFAFWQISWLSHTHTHFPKRHCHCCGKLSHYTLCKDASSFPKSTHSRTFCCFSVAFLLAALLLLFCCFSVAFLLLFCCCSFLLLRWCSSVALTKLHHHFCSSKIWLIEHICFYGLRVLLLKVKCCPNSIAIWLFPLFSQRRLWNLICMLRYLAALQEETKGISGCFQCMYHAPKTAMTVRPNGQVDGLEINWALPRGSNPFAALNASLNFRWI